jgi:RHS repeat-associated protein
MPRMPSRHVGHQLARGVARRGRRVGHVLRSTSAGRLVSSAGVAPATTSGSDTFTLTRAYAGQPGTCAGPIWLGASAYYCFDVYVDPGFGSLYIAGEFSWNVVDACGTVVDGGSDQPGTLYNYPSAGGYTWAEIAVVPTTACYGTWTMNVGGSQKFPDGQVLNSSVSGTFHVYDSQADFLASQHPQGQPVGGPVDPSSQQGGCGCGFPVHASVAQPVDTASGNFWHTFDDLAIPGRGPAIDLSRTYNSLSAATDGPFGFGWTDSYGMSLTIGPSTVVVNQQNGAQATFTLANGVWSAPPRELATLVNNADGSWTFTRQARQIFDFDSSGRLTAIRDLNGYLTTVTYPSGSTMVVTDPAGRTLTLALTGNHVTSVQDSSSPTRTLTYSYDGAGNLTDVIDAGNGHWTFTYDASHRLITMRTPRFYGDTTTTPTPVTTNHYDASGRVDWQSDQLGRTTTFDYTSIPGSTKATDPKGNVTVYRYTYGLLTSLTRGYGTAQKATWYYRYDTATTGRTILIDPNARMTTSTYDGAGNVLSVQAPLNRTTQYGYNALGEVTSITEPKQINGQAIKTTLTYDSAGNLLTRSSPLLDASGNTTATATTTYHADDPAHPGDVTSITGPNNHTTLYGYDADGDLTSVTDAVGDMTTYGYDVQRGWRTSMTTPNGNVTGGNPAAFTITYDHNAYGRVTVTTDPLWTSSNPTSHETVRGYDADGNLISFTDGDGKTTTYDYDPAGEQTVTHRPDGTTLQIDYWPDGTPHHRYDGANQPTAYSYDAQARLTTVTDTLGRTTTFGYDPVGNLTTRKDASNRTTTSSYNADNELTGISYSDGVTPNVTNIGYDADGQRTSMTDGTGSSSWAFDSLHRLTSSSNGATQAVGYQYDLGGRLTTITYPGTTGSVVRGYDDADRLHTVTDWNSNRTTFDYDANSNLITETYPNSTTAKTGYDDADQISSISDAPTATPNSPFVSFSYGRDGANQVTSATSTGVPSDTHTFGYDNLERLGQVDSSTYSYDAADNLTKQPDNTQQIFDLANQLTATTTNPPISLVGTKSAGDSTSSSLTLTLPTGTAANDQILIAVTLANGKSVTTPTGYTVVGTCTSGTSNTAAKVVLFRRTAVAGDSSVTVSFQGKIAKTVALAVYRGVNPNSPLDPIANASTASGTSVTAPSITTTVTGDRVVMVTGASGAAGTWAMPASMTARVEQAGGSTDAGIADMAFNTIGATGTQTATHSTSTQLVGVILGLKPAETSFTYDNQGNRTSVTPLGGSTTTLTYDQANRLKAFGSSATYAYDGVGLRASKTVSGTTSNFTWDEAQGLPLLLSEGSTSYVYGPGGLPLERVTSSGTLYYLHDQLGSTRALTDQSGNVVATYSYNAFGKVTGTTGSVTNPFTYAGQYSDTESGLTYLRARYYDPTTAQFLTRDPLESVSGSPYGYADDDPLDASDPSGLLCVLGHNSDGSCRGSGVVNAAVGAVKEGAHLADDAVTDPFYLMYWGSLDANGAIHWTLGHAFGQAGCHIADVVAAPLLPSQALGLGVDVAGDWFKEHVLHVPNYTVGDEGDPNAYLLGSQVGPLARHVGINWRHDFPGVHPDGHVDWRW